MPLIRTLIEGTQRLLGVSPAHLVKMLPRAWQTLSQGTGDFDVTTRGARARIKFGGLPPHLAESTAYVWTFAGTIDGFLEQTNTRGEVTVEPGDWAQGCVSYRVYWS